MTVDHSLPISPQVLCSEHHSGDPAGSGEGNVVVNKGGDYGVAHVIVLTIGGEAGRRAKLGVGGGGASIAERASDANQRYGGHRREIKRDTEWYIDCGNDWQRRERRADAHRHDQPNYQHGQRGHGLVVSKELLNCSHEWLDVVELVDDRGKTLRGDHDKTDERHHTHARGEDIIGFIPLNDTRDEENAQADEGT